MFQQRKEMTIIHGWMPLQSLSEVKNKTYHFEIQKRETDGSLILSQALASPTPRESMSSSGKQTWETKSIRVYTVQIQIVMGIEETKNICSGC